MRKLIIIFLLSIILLACNHDVDNYNSGKAHFKQNNYKHALNYFK